MVHIVLYTLSVFCILYLVVEQLGKDMDELVVVKSTPDLYILQFDFYWAAKKPAG